MADASFFFRRNPYATEQVTVSTGVATPTAALVANTAQTETDGSTPVRWAFTYPATAAIAEIIGANGLIYTLDGSTPTSESSSARRSMSATARRRSIRSSMRLRSPSLDITARSTYCER